MDDHLSRPFACATALTLAPETHLNYNRTGGQVVSYDRGVKLCAALPVFFFFKIVIDFVIYHSSQRDYKIRVYILSRKIFHQFKIFFKRGSQSQSPIQTGYYQAFISNAVDNSLLMAC